MLTETLATLFERDILKLKTEINAYQDGEKLWLPVPGTNNAGGNLCLHLLGNLRHYIANILGDTPYIRTREKEFTDKNVPVAEINRTIDEVAPLVAKTIRNLSPETLAALYPEKVFAFDMTTEYFLLHLLAHLSYHLGQINYHRRMIEHSVL